MDRIADIWGTRTPHARDTPWPVRVDLHLDDGLSVDDVERWVPSACVLCSNGCGAEIAVRDGRMVGIRGRADDVVNHGRLGPKGLYGSTRALHSPDRLTRPLVRDEHGALVETDWETAMGRVVARSRRSLAESGRAAAALRDRDLVDLAATGSRDAARQVRWLRSRTELAAAQALVVG